MDQDFPQPFGPYQLQEKIGQGGMAEIFRAQLTGPNGFAKEFAIKRILPSLVHNDEFIKQFLDEARIAGSLSHPNIVQINDIGDVDGQYYILMEYVDGDHLGEVIRRSIEKMGRVPLHTAVGILTEVAKSLAFAHTAKDHDGNPMEIIHRDVSPQNVLISRHGSVKLTDFGIARAANRLHHTSAGVIKGKFSYLSPEQLHGKPVSTASDLFSYGIMFWETLTGHRLFLGKSDILTIKAVQACEVPDLNKYRDDVPEELEAILKQLLDRDPRKRPESAHEVAQRLSQIMLDYGIPGELSALADFMVRLYPEKYQQNIDVPATEIGLSAVSLEMLKDAQEYQNAPLGELDEETTDYPIGERPPDLADLSRAKNQTDYLSAPNTAESLDAVDDSDVEDEETQPYLEQPQGWDTKDENADTAPYLSTELLESASKSKKYKILFISLLVFLSLGTVVFLYISNQRNSFVEEPLSKASIEIVLDPPQAKLKLNGKIFPGKGSLRKAINLSDGKRYRITAQLKGYKTRIRWLVANDGQNYHFRIRLKRKKKQKR